MATGDIPRPTVQRLSLYLRALDQAVAASKSTISSSTIASTFGLTDAQVRRDLACLGQTGRPGVGYQPKSLASKIRAALSIDRTWNLIIIGVGKIGSALMGYPQFAGGGFKIVAALDADPALHGQTVAGLRVRPLDELNELAAAMRIDVAILAVPADAAQDVAESVVEAGIHGILNFAPVRLKVDVPVEPIDLSRSLEQLAFNVASRDATDPETTT
ncbi:MAG: redox-sensing transcriptional repressor Rex [Phycisphaerales bacterium]|nr:redox-sensing transcriptional repressor Rex [Phycisphaerales bacterium]